MDQSANSLVLGKDGLRGRLVSALPDAEKSNGRALLRLEDGQQLYVPADALQQQEDGSYYLPLSAADLRQANSQSGHGPETVLTAPVIAEQLTVEKRLVETGRIHIHKQVLEQEQVVDEPLLRQEVAVDHVPINQVWEGAPPPVRYEGETLVIPLLEEVLVVEKRLMLKEELHIHRVQRTVHAPQTVTVRREEVTVEQVGSAPEQANDNVSRDEPQGSRGPGAGL
jgi:uncharacterized protein (TIGR02271 family)